MTIDYGTIIRTRRQEKGWSQAYLAERCGCGRNLIIEAEQDAESKKFGMILLILYELDLELEIVDEDDLK